jgi:glycosyltransferase involved in cell wall biosynthesis
MAQSPRVSMIMPVYNGARFLADAINSVLAQDFDDFELICVNDGSVDETPQILADFARHDRRIVHSDNPNNLGLPATLNRGFALAQGAYLSWTSHDNLLRPDMLSTLLGVLDAEPSVAVAYGGYSIIDEGGRVQRYQPPRGPEERFFCNPVGAAFLYRAEVDRALGGYDESLFGAEDYDFWLRAARRFAMRPVDRDLYLYRRHDASITDRRSRAIKDMVAALVQRELANTSDARLKARALLNLVLTDHARFRPALLREALRADAATTVSAAPKLVYHLARVALASLRS